MKIMLVLDSLGSGGAERSTYLMAKHLVETKLEVCVVALKEKKIGIAEEFNALPINVYVCSEKGRPGRLRLVKQIIRKERPDLIHSVLYESNVLVRIAVRSFPGIELVQSLVNTPYLPFRTVPGLLGSVKFGFAKYVDIATARFSDIHYHGISQSVLKHYQPLFGFDIASADLIYRGRQDNHLVQEKRSLRSGRFVLINVGRQDAQKDQVTAVRALGLLKRDYNREDVVLYSYGRPGSETPEIKRAIEEFGLQDQVKLMGFSTDIERAYREADAFVFPSRFEGLGGSMIEAMAAKLPILCSDIPILREVVGADDGALFFPPGDAARLCEQIHRIIKDARLYEKLSEHSYKRFQTTFTEAETLKQTVAMYKRILGLTYVPSSSLKPSS